MTARKFSCVAPVLAALALCASARAEEARCASPATPANLSNYRPVFLACENAAGAKKLAMRRMSAGNETLLLAVDPQSLKTSLEREACWRCAETTDEKEIDTRFLRALQKPPEGAVAKALENAGLTHSPSDAGAFVTADLCPSRRPLDRDFLERFAKEGPGTPIALSVSGRWLAHHAADLAWLKAQAASGALKISWVNHSYSHPFVRNRPDDRTYLLTQGVDIDREIFETEKLMIIDGLTPSVFFRFPGLVSDDGLMAKLRERHLVALGADAWVALGFEPRPGSIVLLHANGNEEVGLRLFSRLLDENRVARPLRPIEEAPAER